MGKYSKEIKSVYWKDTFTHMFIAVLFTRAKTQKQPKYLLTDEWIREYDTQTHTPAQNGIYFSHKKDGNPAMCDSMDESWGPYAKWHKPSRER